MHIILLIFFSVVHGFSLKNQNFHLYSVKKYPYRQEPETISLFFGKVTVVSLKSVEEKVPRKKKKEKNRIKWKI